MATDPGWAAQWQQMSSGVSSAPSPAPANDWASQWLQGKTSASSVTAKSAAKAAPINAANYDPYSPASMGQYERAVAAQTPGKQDPVGTLLGVPDAALSAATSTAGSAVGGLAGLGDAALKKFGLKVPAPADVVNGVTNALTYEPRTSVGKALLGIASLPAQGANWAGQKVATATGSPALGALTNTAIQAIPMLFGDKLPALRDAPVKAPEIPAAVARARALGLKVTPTEAEVPGGTLGRALTSLTNEAKLERTISRKNAPIVNAIAARDVGIRGPITPESIDAAYAPHRAVYDEVSALGPIKTDETYQGVIRGQQAPGEGSFPKDVKPAVSALRNAYDVPQFDAADAVARIRQLRKEGNARVYGGKYDPDNAALGHAQLGIAKALEEQIDRHLKGISSGTQEVKPSTGGPTATAQARADWMAQAKDLIPRYRAARQGMAKLANFERAWNAGNEEQVSARSLGQQLKKGAPLSGNLRTIAESARKFPRALQDISKLRNTGPLSNLDFKLEGGLGAIHPVAALKAAPAFLAAPLTRALLSSDLYQRSAFGPFKTPTKPSFPALLSAGRALPLIGSSQSPVSQLLAQALLAR